jgi:hypothetical protein
MKSKFDGQIIQYVPHGFIHAFERVGWVVEPPILQGIHHGDYSEAMRWAGEGDYVFPTEWRKVA